MIGQEPLHKRFRDTLSHGGSEVSACIVLEGVLTNPQTAVRLSNSDENEWSDLVWKRMDTGTPKGSNRDTAPVSPCVSERLPFQEKGYPGNP